MFNINRKKNKHKIPLPKEAKGRHAVIYPITEAESIKAEILLPDIIKVLNELLNIDIEELCQRMKEPPYWVSRSVGEHYKLLAAFVKALKPLNIIEIGTFTGLSALSMKKYLPPQGCIHTFDILEWNKMEDTSLTPDDFKDNRLIQHIDDVSSIDTFNKYSGLFQSADLIFIDGPKDEHTEKAIINNLNSLKFDKPPFVIFDDIKFWNMTKIWYEINKPKLDLTSFGHFSGTGVVKWL